MGLYRAGSPSEVRKLAQTVSASDQLDTCDHLLQEKARSGHSVALVKGSIQSASGLFQMGGEDQEARP